MEQLPWWIWVGGVWLVLHWFFSERSRRELQQRVLDLEIRLHRLQEHVGFVPDVNPVISQDVQVLARTPGAKIEAIKLYRRQTGAGLREAKEAVERMARL